MSLLLAAAVCSGYALAWKDLVLYRTHRVVIAAACAAWCGTYNKSGKKSEHLCCMITLLYGIYKLNYELGSLGVDIDTTLTVVSVIGNSENLEVGDQILKVNGNLITKTKDLRNTIKQATLIDPHPVITFEAIRNNEIINYTSSVNSNALSVLNARYKERKKIWPSLNIELLINIRCAPLISGPFPDIIEEFNLPELVSSDRMLSVLPPLLESIGLPSNLIKPTHLLAIHDSACRGGSDVANKDVLLPLLKRAIINAVDDMIDVPQPIQNKKLSR